MGVYITHWWETVSFRQEPLRSLLNEFGEQSDGDFRIIVIGARQSTMGWKMMEAVALMNQKKAASR